MALTTGFNDGTVYTEDLYFMRRMPALYLLDERRRVIAKDLTPGRLAGLIDKMMGASGPTRQPELP